MYNNCQPIWNHDVNVIPLFAINSFSVRSWYNLKPDVAEESTQPWASSSTPVFLCIPVWSVLGFKEVSPFPGNPLQISHCSCLLLSGNDFYPSHECFGWGFINIPSLSQKDSNFQAYCHLKNFLLSPSPFLKNTPPLCGHFLVSLWVVPPSSSS